MKTPSELFPPCPVAEDGFHDIPMLSESERANTETGDRSSTIVLRSRLRVTCRACGRSLLRGEFMMSSILNIVIDDA
jgi:hypothetical protein